MKFLRRLWELVRDQRDLPISREEAINRMQRIQVAVPKPVPQQPGPEPEQSWGATSWPWPSPQQLTDITRRMLLLDAMQEMRLATAGRATH